MTLQAPHWLTGLIAIIGATCGALVAANTFPAYTSILGGVSAVCTIFTAPSIKPKEPT